MPHPPMPSRASPYSGSVAAALKPGYVGQPLLKISKDKLR